jgi:hypothetical protein
MRDRDWKLLATVRGVEDTRRGSGFDHDFSTIRQGQLDRFELYCLGCDVAERDDRADARPDRLDPMSQTLQRIYDHVINEGPTWPVAK